MARIGKRTGAKKYKKLRELQATANRMLYKSTHIEKTNGKRKQVLAMKRQFYKSRGIKNPSRLSFKDLSPKDIKAYEQLLQSIINNTYINPEKYKQYQDKMREKFNEQGYDFEYDKIKDILESDYISDLIEIGMSPSEFWQVYGELTKEYGEIDEEDFFDMLRAFRIDFNNGDVTIDDFFVYADEWYARQRAYKERNNLYE